jgi:hypothetical protein
VNLSEWVNDVDGRVIGDGQCVALCQDYSARVALGGFLSTDTGPYPGYAGNIWTSDIAGYTRAKSTAIAMPGWLAVWGKSAFTPSTHIAVVLNDAGIGVNCMTQNPGAAQHMVIPKIGLLGYLVPGTNTGNMVLAGDIVNDYQTGTKVVTSLDTLKNWVSEAGNWQRIGLYTLGFILVLMAVLFLFRNDAMKLVKEKIA